MGIIEIIILGIIQGIAEFLPISSSAHLIIFRDIFGIGNSISSDVALAFDIALHLGTLLAILIFFCKDFIKMIKSGFNFKDKKASKILWYIALATIPAGVFGILFDDKIEGLIRNSYYLIAGALIIMGVIIYLADKYSSKLKDIEDITIKDSIIIGCAQIFALIPGFSRSGTTIAAGRLRGINREDAAKFSFYLSAPVVLGAVLVTFLKGETITIISANMSLFIIGIFTSFIVGLLCIAFLLKYLQKHNFKIFMWYRIALALVVIVTLILK